jgi:hypothetical protein
MTQLLADAIQAHGGLDRWTSRRTLTATFVTGGEFLALKGIEDQTARTVRIDLHRQWASVEPFGRTGGRTDFTPDRIAIVRLDGSLVAERSNPRASFARHDLRTNWDPLHRAYFSACALWTYLTTPFLLAMDGFKVSEIEPWREGAEIWRGVRAIFPAHIASHSSEQDFYFGPDMLIRRHDYRMEIAGNVPVAQYISDHVDAEGIRIPTKRRVYLRDDDLTPMLDTPLSSIDLSAFRFD